MTVSIILEEVDYILDNTVSFLLCPDEEQKKKFKYNVDKLTNADLKSDKSTEVTEDATEISDKDD